ncbi:MAG: toxic anion resistance protein [Bilifractor sp.]|jgi:uncharacterized protein YaaN involved in tellurite resistance
MSEENNLQEEMEKAPAAPTLTFGDEQPVSGINLNTPSAAPQVPAAEKAQEQEQLQLTPEEEKAVDEFVKKIDLSNSTAIMNYGVATQKNLTDFSQKAIDNVRTKDMGEIGDMLAGLITELKNFDVDENEKGILGFFKKKKNQMDEIKAKYSKVETNVTAVSNQLEQHEAKLLKDSQLLDRMYELNLNYYRELTMYIAAGKKKLEQVRTGELQAAQQKAASSGQPEDAQAAKDLAAQCERFEKKIYDLELTRTIALQTSPQIRMLQNSDMQMAEKIQSTIVNTIPLWKNQMVIAIGMEHASQAARAEREVNNMTNDLLKKNADKLHEVTVATAKENERGIVDIETLQHTNDTLISAIDEIMAIQKEGKEKRAAAEQQLNGIEKQLHDKLLEASQA